MIDLHICILLHRAISEIRGKLEIKDHFTKPSIPETGPVIPKIRHGEQGDEPSRSSFSKVAVDPL